jgi:hypothetical protein
MNLPALKEIVEERKEKAIEDLSVSFAKNRLPLEEYERLVEYVNKIESERELIVVEKIVAEYGAEPKSGKSSEPEPSNDEDDADDENVLQSSSSNNLTMLSSRTFSGHLKSGAQFVSVLGSARIKVRKRHLNKAQTVLNITSVLGDHVILVESGIRVTNKAVPVLGSSTTNKKVDKAALPDAPELVITGLALLGDISVKLLRE